MQTYKAPHMGRRLKKLLATRGIRPIDLARKTGWPRQRIWLLEQQQTFAVPTIKRLAWAMDVPSSEFLGE